MAQKILRSSGFLICLVWLTIFISTASFVLTTNKRQIKYDGVFYFSTLRSIYFDRDIDFSNEAIHYPWILKILGFFDKTLPNRPIANPFPVGSAILWSPFYAIADVYCKSQSNFVCDGYSQPYVIAVMVGTVFWTTLGLVLNVLSLKQLFPTSSLWSTSTAVLAMTLASPLIFYLTVDVDYAHGNSFFAISLILYLTLAYLRKVSLLRWQMFLYGLLVGLAFLVRWQDIIVGVLAFPFLLNIQRYKRLDYLIILAMGTLIGAIPQLLFWGLLYGKLFTIPQGNNFLSIYNIDVLKFLFSTWNGVFLWHPLILLAMVGLLVFTRRSLVEPQSKWRILALMTCLVVFFEMVVSAMSQDWWAGGAFGQRRLVSALPLLCIGLQQVYSDLRQSKMWAKISLAFLIIILVAWNLLTLSRYHQGTLPINPADRNAFSSKQVYAYYDYLRRFGDILTGNKP